MKSLSEWRRLKFWWFRRNHSYPSHQEMIYVLARTPIRSFRTLSVGTTYCENLGNLEATAKDFNVTRERVRQILWKLWRSVNDLKLNLELREHNELFDNIRNSNGINRR